MRSVGRDRNLVDGLDGGQGVDRCRNPILSGRAESTTRQQNHDDPKLFHGGGSIHNSSLQRRGRDSRLHSRCTGSPLADTRKSLLNCCWKVERSSQPQRADGFERKRDLTTVGCYKKVKNVLTGL